MSGLHLRHWPGDPDRPALALHCMMGSGSAWGPIARLLEGRVDLRGFDMPGHGRSDDWQPQPDGPDYHTAVTRLAALAASAARLALALDGRLGGGRLLSGLCGHVVLHILSSCVTHRFRPPSRAPSAIAATRPA